MFGAQIKWTLIDYYLKTDIFITHSVSCPEKYFYSDYLSLVEWFKSHVFDVWILWSEERWLRHITVDWRWNNTPRKKYIEKKKSSNAFSINIWTARKLNFKQLCLADEVFKDTKWFFSFFCWCFNRISFRREIELSCIQLKLQIWSRFFPSQIGIKKRKTTKITLVWSDNFP